MCFFCTWRFVVGHLCTSISVLGSECAGVHSFPTCTQDVTRKATNCCTDLDVCHHYVPQRKKFKTRRKKQTNKRTEWTILCLSLMVLFWWSSENHIAFSHWMDRSASSFVAFYSLFLFFGTCLHSIYTWMAVIHRRRRHRRRHHQRCFYSTTIQH